MQAVSLWFLSYEGGFMKPSSKSITQLLVEWRNGDTTALDELTPLVYEEMHRLANHYMRSERQGHTLQTSALVNEAYIRLVDHKNMRWQNRAHFFGVAAQAMRRILVDHARSRNYAKRSGKAWKVELDEGAVVAEERAAELIALDDVLMDLARLDPRKSQLVELRYFGGLSIDETAEALGIAPITVRREWRKAKAWLHRALSKGDRNGT